MKCAHCGRCDGNVTVDHVWECSQGGTLRDAVATPVVKTSYGEKLAADRADRGLTLGRADLAGKDVSGVYCTNLTYYKVQKSQSGHFYAKQFRDGNWDYAGRGPLFVLREGDKVTATQAAAFGAVYGECVFCAKTLTDERSIAVGYGSTCAANNGLPWGETLAAESPGYGALLPSECDECGDGGYKLDGSPCFHSERQAKPCCDGTESAPTNGDMLAKLFR